MKSNLLFVCFFALLSYHSEAQNWVNLPDHNNLLQQDTRGLIGYSPNSVYAIGYGIQNDNPSVLYWDGNNWTTLPQYSLVASMGSFCGSPSGKLYISGAMPIAPTGNWITQEIERWNGANWEKLINDTFFTPNPNLLVFTDRNENIYAAGARGLERKNILVQWNGTSWSQLGHLFSENSQFGHPYGGVVDHNGRIYLYGYFRDSSNNNFFIQYWDGTAWQKLMDPVMNGDIRSAIVDNNNNLIICCTRSVGNQWVPYVLKWDNVSWSQVGDVNPLNYLGTLYVDRNDNLYCLGIPLENGNYVTHLTKLVNNQWQEFGGNSSSVLNANRRITAVMLDTLNNLYVGGHYLDNPASKYVVRYDPNANPTAVYDLTAKSKEDFTVYPNPNTGEFNIIFDEKASYSEMVIYNMNGIEVYRKPINARKIEAVNLTESVRGLYLMKLYKGKDVVVKKITVM